MSHSDAPIRKRWWLLSAWTVLSLLLFIKPVIALVRLSLSQDDASHIVIIPLLSAAVLYLDRHKISPQVTVDKTLGGLFLFLAGCLALATRFGIASSPCDLQLSGWILAFVLTWEAGFGFLFGKRAFTAAAFPLLFLLLMVPIPNFVLNRIIALLQEGSAWITGAFFDLVRVPALREGLVFHLPGVNIEVARECSGIRSSMALLILALLVAHFRLRNLWNKILLVIVGLFMMILKNGIRIATLTLLAVYVDPSFLFGRLHRQGGLVFFTLALLLLLPLLILLERAESRKSVLAKIS